MKREDVYNVLATPAGVDRAFKKLDQIKSNIQWWESGAQPLQWLVAGDVVMTSAYNGRVAVAQKEKPGINIVWKDGLYDLDSWAIVKGSKHKALAEQFIAFANQPENQKVFAENIAYGPTNGKTTALLDPRSAATCRPRRITWLSRCRWIPSSGSITAKSWSSASTPGLPRSNPEPVLITRRERLCPRTRC